MDERILKDMVTLVDGAMREFVDADWECNEWEEMDEKEKMEWCDKFASKHARIIGSDEVRETEKV